MGSSHPKTMSEMTKPPCKKKNMKNLVDLEEHLKFAVKKGV